MKLKKLLVFLSMAFCLASGAKAQFYDSADDIYYYVVERNDGKSGGWCFIFNFDGKNACVLSGALEDDARYPIVADDVKKKLSQNADFLENSIETGLYDVQWVSGNTYKKTGTYSFNDPNSGYQYGEFSWTFKFSNDREIMYWTLWNNWQGGPRSTTQNERKFKRVDKSYFKLGRSRKPSNTLYE